MQKKGNSSMEVENYLELWREDLCLLKKEGRVDVGKASGRESMKLKSVSV